MTFQTLVPQWSSNVLLFSLNKSLFSAKPTPSKAIPSFSISPYGKSDFEEITMILVLSDNFKNTLETEREAGKTQTWFAKVLISLGLPAPRGSFSRTARLRDEGAGSPRGPSGEGVLRVPLGLERRRMATPKSLPHCVPTTPNISSQELSCFYTTTDSSKLWKTPLL